MATIYATDKLTGVQTAIAVTVDNAVVDGGSSSYNGVARYFVTVNTSAKTPSGKAIPARTILTTSSASEPLSVPVMAAAMDIMEELEGTASSQSSQSSSST